MSISFELSWKPSNPFAPVSLPLISKLHKAGLHRYRNRWAKRLGKRPARLVFDFAYNQLRLGGRLQGRLCLPDKDHLLSLNARALHFGQIYLNDFQMGFEPEVSMLLKHLLVGGRVFFDVGANWGYHSFFASSLPDYSGEVHAFEPAPPTFNDLKTVLAQTGLEPRITAHEMALSDHEGSGRLVFDPDHTGLAHLTNDDVTSDGSEFRISITTLDKLSLPHPDVIKLDAENHELSVLQGGRRLFEENKPYLIFENWKQNQEPATTLAPLEFLQDINFGLFYPRWRLGEMLLPVDHKAFAALQSANSKSLVYTQFEPNERFELADQLNVFACHEDRIGSLPINI